MLYYKSRTYMVGFADGKNTTSCDFYQAGGSERILVFNGLQKLTLLDFPGKVACTLFTAGCDFRCPFCHNASLVYRDDKLDAFTEDEIFSFLRKRQGILEGVAITGGEPMLNSGLPEFMEKVKELGYAVKLDTNGSYPDRLAKVIENGLVDKIAMDIKNSKEKYGLTVGIPDYDIRPIEESVDILLGCGIDYEFRTTVTADFHEESDFEKIGAWIKGAKAYFLQNFVNSGELIDESIQGVSAEIMNGFLAVVQKYIPGAQLRGVE